MARLVCSIYPFFSRGLAESTPVSSCPFTALCLTSKIMKLSHRARADIMAGVTKKLKKILAEGTKKRVTRELNKSLGQHCKNDTTPTPIKESSELKVEKVPLCCFNV